MRIVCGKCGSANIYEHQGVVPGDGQTGHSLSCLKCGNTSESKKYGFRTDKEMDMSSSEMGTCTNCGRTRLIIKNMDICFTCQKAAQGTRGDARVRALADIREKILAGKKQYGGDRKSRTVKARAGKGGDCGADMLPGQPDIAPKVEGYHLDALDANLFEDTVKWNPAPPSTFVPGHQFEAPRTSAVPHSHSAGPYYGPVPPGDVIVLAFKTPADRKLLEKIEIMARQYRRTVDQQILWICQNERQLHEDLLKEADCNA